MGLVAELEQRFADDVTLFMSVDDETERPVLQESLHSTYLCVVSVVGCAGVGPT